MKQNKLADFFSILLIALILNSSFAFAETGASDTGTGTDGTTVPPSEPATPPATNDTGKLTEFACKNPSNTLPGETVLLPGEIAKLKQAVQSLDELNAKPFTGKAIEAPDAKKTEPADRDKLENSKIVLPTGNGNEAFLNTLPDLKFNPGEAPFLFNKSSQGPFAVGISLDDTLRIGRCEDLQSQLDKNQNSCPMIDRQLEFRNSGEGITQDFKNVWNDLKDWVGIGPDVEDTYTDKETEQIKTALASETDPEKVTYKQVSRVPGNPIKNSIKTQSFGAEIGSTCQTADCTISSYSAFDKYFNSWFSSEMVISNFGPTLLGQAKRYLGYLGRRGWPWDLSNNSFVKAFRKNFMTTGSLLGDARAANTAARIDKFGFGEYRKILWEGTGWQEGYQMIKGGSTRRLLDDWLKAGGKLDTEITDPVRRGEFFKLIKEWRSFAKTNSALIDDYSGEYAKIVEKYGMDSIEGKSALIDYGQKTSRLMRDMDRVTRLDYPEFWAKDEAAGIYNMAVKDAKTGTMITLTEDSANINGIMAKFERDGTWANWEASPPGGDYARIFETTPDGFLKMYKPDPTGKFLGSYTVEDVEKHFSRFQDKMIQLENGEFIKLDSTSVGHILKSGTPTGEIRVYDLGWKPEIDMTPEDWAARFTRYRVKSRIMGNMNLHADRLYNALIEKGWAGQNRRYLSLLDKAMAQEEEILKSYFSLKGGTKWTVMPFVYWGLKRGVGFEGLSAYQLPDSWRAAQLSLGETKLYNDAFMDFFANEGSDEGDLFAQVLNVLPWKMILNKATEQYKPLEEKFNYITGKGPAGYRSNVENVALFSQTGDECKTCSWNYAPKGVNPETGIGTAGISLKTREGLSSILLEDVISDDAKEKGSTLISFAHHTNIDWTGPEKSDAGDTKLDLVQAQNDKKTCKDALEKIPIVGSFGKIVDGKPQRIGAFLSFGETMGYFVFGWPGIFGSAMQQILIAPEFQDCVDDVEGYYIHIFAPAKEQEKKAETPNQLGSEKATDIFKNLTGSVLGPSNPDDKSKTFVDVVKDKVKEETQQLADKANAKSVLQAKVDAKNYTTGNFEGKQLFFLWYKGEQNASKYDKTSKALIKDTDNGTELKIDNAKGEISFDGKPVITTPDQVRLAAPNGNIPAWEIPQRMTKIVLPSGSTDRIFQMGINSELLVDTTSPVGQSILNCIKQGVEEQTGVKLNSQNLSDAFGKVKSIVSDTHPSIVADELSKTITAEGIPREIVYGDSAAASINASRDIELSGNAGGKGLARVGKMESIQFEQGVIVYKAETNELLIWLKRHDKAILNQNDVEGLIATPTTVKNPETQCEEPAINLEAIPKSGSDAIAAKVDNFNASMQKMGPFQVFDTDTHRYIFYSKLENGVCKPYFKMINKQTGEVYDQPINGAIEKTPTGIKFTTADGQTHTLDFGAENGAPVISYNKQPNEILKTATGPNGSFWYDPSTGNWYPENAQLIPLDEAFRQKGFSTAVGADGKVSQVPGGNPLTVNVGGGSGMPFNLPSLPEGIAMLVFLSLLLCTIFMFRLRAEKKHRAK
ncbi:MAG: hypothetical protein PHD95_05630 [Candidatus ainarchaeum sp.]|nr:hypothetical protein [Candidatus ainarchaeum sp.]